MSPHTKASVMLGKSKGPYTAKCSGSRDDLTVDVSAPDGWTAVFESDSNRWTLRKKKGGNAATITGNASSISYLKYQDYVVDSESFGKAPSNWEMGDENVMNINMYIDCHPPTDDNESPTAPASPPTTTGPTSPSTTGVPR